MIGRKGLPGLAVLALLLGGPARATLPPPVPPEYGAYGPLAICEGDVSIVVRPTEAAHIVGSIFRVINDDYLVAATPALLPVEALALPDGSVRNELSLHGNLPLVYRYTGDLPERAKRDMVFARQGFEGGEIRYAIDALSGGSSSDTLRPMLIIASPSFAGSDADRAILTRFRMDAADVAACIRPADLAAGKQDYDKAGLVRSFDDPFYAGLYPAVPTEGPGYHCQGGVGFAFHPGERLRRPWRSLGTGKSFLMRGGVSVKIEGPVRPMQRVDPGDANEHPVGQLHQSGIIFYPSRGVGPPYAAPGVREDGSWLVELGKDRANRLEVSFPAGDKARIGFALLERLAFVAPDDPRCAAPVAR